MRCLTDNALGSIYQNKMPKWHKKAKQRRKKMKGIVRYIILFRFKVVGVLNERQFQFKFGVFTKWDEVTKKMSETKRQQARKNYKERFEQSVKDKQEVYFVEAENTTLATVSFEFMYSGGLIGAT